MVRVFVVDDDRSIRDLLRIALELEGYEVTTFGNGRQMIDAFEACSRAQQAPSAPGVILMDMMMPVMDGWAVCQYLEAHGEVLGESRLIAMSAAAEPGDEAPPLAQMLLCKPFHLDRLLELVAAQAALLPQGQMETPAPAPELLPVAPLATLRAAG